MAWWDSLFQRSNPASPPPDGRGGVGGGIAGWLRDRLGGWAGPAFGAGSPAGRELVAEKVHSGPSGMALPWFPPFIDNYTRETSEHRVAYRQMVGECNVKAALFGKLWGVSS